MRVLGPGEHEVGRTGTKVAGMTGNGLRILGHQHQVRARLNPMTGMRLRLIHHHGSRVVFPHIAVQHPHKAVVI